jgi:uncharacterized protein (TIGR03663 family)
MEWSPARLKTVLFIVIVLAAVLRLPALTERPMHADEAVHADKFGTLLEEGRYAYDSYEYHGPTLYYLTLPSAWLRGEGRYVEIDEATLRAVPALLGVLLVAAHVWARGFLGAPAAAVAALLTALSPAMVYYSRYYIHETPLVLFTFGALLGACWYLRSPGPLPAVTAGVCVGLMHASKETAPLALGSMVLALVVVLVLDRGERSPRDVVRGRLSGRDLALSVLTAALVSAVLYSSFLTHPAGLVDSVRAYGIWLARAGTDSWHAHPWDYYFRLLIHFPADGTPVWSEGLILVLAVAGAVAAWSPRRIPGADPRVLRFLALYTLILALGYAAIPYKTPWCLLGFLHGMILLAGAGTVWIVQAFRGATGKVAISTVLLVGMVHLGWQSWSGSFRFPADPRNPYVYAHTGTDVFEIAGRLEQVARSRPDGEPVPLQVISRENLWPLPWYLRRLPRVGWWTGVSMEAETAPLVVVTPDMEPALVHKLYEVPPPGEREMYVRVFDRPLELRPQVEVRGYASKPLWDDFRRLEAESTVPPGSRP